MDSLRKTVIVGLATGVVLSAIVRATYGTAGLDVVLAVLGALLAAQIFVLVAIAAYEKLLPRLVAWREARRVRVANEVVKTLAVATYASAEELGEATGLTPEQVRAAIDDLPPDMAEIRQQRIRRHLLTSLPADQLAREPTLTREEIEAALRKGAEEAEVWRRYVQLRPPGRF